VVLADPRWGKPRIWFGPGLGLALREEYDRAVQTGAERQIVIATDGSKSAGHAVSAGCRLASALGAKAVLLYVRPTIAALGEPYRQERLTEQMKHARVALDDAREIADDEGVESDEEVLEGHAADEIVALAHSGDALLIVVGSRGLGGLKGMLLGSVGHHCAAHAHCPVVIVHPVPVPATRKPDRRTLSGTPAV